MAKTKNANVQFAIPLPGQRGDQLGPALDALMARFASLKPAVVWRKIFELGMPLLAGNPDLISKDTTPKPEEMTESHYRSHMGSIREALLDSIEIGLRHGLPKEDFRELTEGPQAVPWERIEEIAARVQTPASAASPTSKMQEAGIDTTGSKKSLEALKAQLAEAARRKAEEQTAADAARETTGEFDSLKSDRQRKRKAKG